jgi:hypothetical protein
MLCSELCYYFYFPYDVLFELFQFFGWNPILLVLSGADYLYFIPPKRRILMKCAGIFEISAPQMKCFIKFNIVFMRTIEYLLKE